MPIVADAGEQNGEGECPEACHEATRCLDALSMQTCFDYDEDGCAEWGGDQSCDLGCSNGACCATHAFLDCVDGDVYWYDSCWREQDIAQDCGGLGCESGQCKNQSCTYASVPAYPSSSSDALYACEGGITMSIAGEVSDEGMITIHGWRLDGEPFPAGDYVVRVFNPAMWGQCADINKLKPATVGGVGMTEIVFEPFPSLLQCFGEPKGYCIATRKDGTAPWSCSGKLVVSYD